MKNSISFSDFVSKYKRLFWDVSLNSIDKSKHKDFVIERVLENGDSASLNELFKLYTEQEIIETIVNSRKITKKTANFWQIRLNIKEPIKCLQKQFQDPLTVLWS